MHHQQLDTSIPTYARGAKRIDYLFATNNILPYVTKSGILPFHFITHTDHRALYVDIDLQKFLRCQLPYIPSTATRSLSTKHPRGVVHYCKQLDQWLQHHQLDQELASGIHPSITSSHFQERLQKLEQSFTEARLQAERSLHKHSKHPWSPKLRQAQLKVLYYKLWLSQYRTGRDYTPHRARLPIAQLDRPQSQQETQQRLRQAQKQLREAKVQAQKLRDQHLEDRITYAQVRGDQQKATTIKAIKRAEEYQQMYSKLRALTTRKHPRAFNHLTVHQGNQQVVLTTPEDMIQHLIIRNRAHFGQAQDTPFTVPPLNAIHSYTQAKQYIHDQTLTEAVRAILRYITEIPVLPSISHQLSVEDVISLYQVWNESTSTSPSGLHLGHEKGLLKYQNNQHVQKVIHRIFQIKTQFINLAIKHGIIYDR